MPLFSIGVTTYDRVEMLVETLNSILAQTFADFEVIVANDNPKRTVTAESLGVHDPRIRFVNNPKNLGELDNMNSLLTQSLGRYFTWIADDDLYAPEFLQRAYEALERFDYPLCVLTSFGLIHGDVVVDDRVHHSNETRGYSGREFLRLYLARRIKTMGVMGLYDREYLMEQGGLADVSADGMGLYCEYLLLVNAGLLPRVAFIDAPLSLYRIHEMSWSCVLNTNTDQYSRAGLNLVRLGIERFQQPELIADFENNLTALLKWFMFEVIIASRRVRPFRLSEFFKFLGFARGYVAPFKGSAIYGKARRCLLRAEIWVGWTLFKQTFLARAPQPIIRLAYFIKSLLRTDPISNEVVRRTAIPNNR